MLDSCLLAGRYYNASSSFGRQIVSTGLLHKQSSFLNNPVVNRDTTHCGESCALSELDSH